MCGRKDKAEDRNKEFINGSLFGLVPWNAEDGTGRFYQDSTEHGRQSTIGVGEGILGNTYPDAAGINSGVSDAGAFVLAETAKVHYKLNPVVTAKLQLNGQDRS